VEVSTLIQRLEKLRDLRRVSLRPGRLRQKVVPDVDATGTEQRKRFFQVVELAGPRVRENKVELPPGECLEKRCAVRDVEVDSGIVSEKSAGDADDGLIMVHGVESRSSFTDYAQKRLTIPNSAA